MKFQDSSFNGLKVTVGTKSVTHAPTHARSKSNMPHQLFQSWGHKQHERLQYKSISIMSLTMVNQRHFTTVFTANMCRGRQG